MGGETAFLRKTSKLRTERSEAYLVLSLALFGARVKAWGLADRIQLARGFCVAGPVFF